VGLVQKYEVTYEGDALGVLADPTGCMNMAIDKRVIDSYGTMINGTYVLPC
jgi:hypothetical protein